jgi:hypothetical protein
LEGNRLPRTATDPQFTAREELLGDQQKWLYHQCETERGREAATLRVEEKNKREKK